jgi:hypothetical protein
MVSQYPPNRQLKFKFRFQYVVNGARRFKDKEMQSHLKDEPQLTLEQVHNNFVEKMLKIYSTACDEDLVAQCSIHDDKVRFLPFQPMFALLNRYAQKKGRDTVDQLERSKKKGNEKDITAYRLMRIIFDIHFLGEQPPYVMFLKDYLTLFSQLLVSIQKNPKAIESSQPPSLSVVAKRMAIYLNVILTVADVQEVGFEFLGENRLALFKRFDALGGGDAEQGSCWQKLFHHLYEKFRSASASKSGRVVLVEAYYPSFMSLYSDPFKLYKVKIEAYALEFASDDMGVDVMLLLINRIANHVEQVIQKFGEERGADGKERDASDVAWAPVAFEVMSLFYLLDKAMGLFVQRAEQPTYGSHLVEVEQFAIGLKELISFVHEQEKSLDGFWGDASPYLLGIASIKAALFNYLQLPVNRTCLLRQHYAASLDSYYSSVSNLLSVMKFALSGAPSDEPSDEPQDALVLKRFICRVEIPLIGLIEEGELKKQGVVHMMHGSDYEAPNFRQYRDIYEALIVTMSCFTMAINSWQVARDSSEAINEAALKNIAAISPLLAQADAKLCEIRDVFNAFRKADHKQSFEEVALLQDSSNGSSNSVEAVLQASNPSEESIESSEELKKSKASPELPELPELAELKAVNKSFLGRYPKAMKPPAPGTPERPIISALVRMAPGSAKKASGAAPFTPPHLEQSPSRVGNSSAISNPPPPPLPLDAASGGRSLMQFGHGGSVLGVGSPVRSSKKKAAVPPPI